MPEETEWDERSARVLEALSDALSGWRYIRVTHGDLPGVGWDRVERKLVDAIALIDGRVHHDRSQTTPKLPWPREKLDTHVAQVIRERVDIALDVYETPNGWEASLRYGGEDAVWSVVREALDKAGWQLCRGDCL